MYHMVQAPPKRRREEPDISEESHSSVSKDSKERGPTLPQLLKGFYLSAKHRMFRLSEATVALQKLIEHVDSKFDYPQDFLRAYFLGNARYLYARVENIPIEEAGRVSIGELKEKLSPKNLKDYVKRVMKEPDREDIEQRGSIDAVTDVERQTRYDERRVAINRILNEKLGLRLDTTTMAERKASKTPLK